MNKLEKREIFSVIANKFENESIKQYFLDMAENVPDYIFTMPASTSGKYHNAAQCKEGGQLQHIFMFFAILEHRLNLKGNKEKFYCPIIRDCMRCTALFHDALKCGTEGAMHTLSNHPLLSAEWVRNTKVEHDIKDAYKEMIACMCESHSGEWNRDREGNKIMPEPRNEMEFFIHECDYLSSRKDIILLCSD